MLGGGTDAALGTAVAGAGDVNGDGLADVLVGSPGADGTTAGSGVVRVYRGRNGSPWLTSAGVLLGTSAGGRYGAAVAGAGDVNGDGYSDVIVGEPSAPNGGFERGRAHVRLGDHAGLGAADAWTFAATQDEAHLGESVAAAGDVNGDGFADVLVAAPDFDVGAADEGRAYLFLGSASGLDATPAWEWSPGQGDARLDAVAAAGDVNGDGRGDVLVGVSRYDGATTDEGMVALFLGTVSGLASTPARMWLGGVAFARLGASLGGRGDADADGGEELLLGARGYTDATASGGAAFLVGANGGQAPTRRFRQRRADDTAAIALLCGSGSPTAFRVAGWARSAAGRTKVGFEVEARRLGEPFTGAALPGAWLDSGAPSPGEGSRVGVSADMTGLTASIPMRWRARVRSRSPFFPTSPWISPAANDPTETDLRTGTLGTAAPPPIPAPAAGGLVASPMPFRHATVLSFHMEEAGAVTLTVYDTAGRLVRRLHDGPVARGETRVAWDGRAADGGAVPAGVYFARLVTSGSVAPLRLVRLR